MGVKKFSNFQKSSLKNFFLPEVYFVEFLGKFWQKSLKIIQFDTILKQKNIKIFEIFGKFFEILAIFRKIFGTKNSIFRKFSKILS